jgi:thymidine kinase
VPICQSLADRGMRVICAGLDQDYRGRPWHPMPELMSLAEYVQKTLAICVVCGNPANRTQRKVASGELVLIGSTDSYEPRCRVCHTVDEPQQTNMFVESDEVAKHAESAPA